MSGHPTREMSLEEIVAWYSAPPTRIELYRTLNAIAQVHTGTVKAVASLVVDERKDAFAALSEAADTLGELVRMLPSMSDEVEAQIEAQTSYGDRNV